MLIAQPQKFPLISKFKSHHTFISRVLPLRGAVLSVKKLIVLRSTVPLGYGLISLLFTSCTLVDYAYPVIELKTQYPVVEYRGPKEAPVVTIQKSRPVSWVSLDRVSKPAKWAVLVSEDAGFYRHQGFDVEAIKDAIETDLEKGKFAKGASTITQQVAKNVFLSRQKSLIRKGKEFLLALSLERHLSKGRILEIYLNIAEWGPGIFGIGPAAHYYFQKNPSHLNAREAAFLAMLLPSPIKYSAGYRRRGLTSFNRRRISTILNRLRQVGVLTNDSLGQARESKFYFEPIQQEPLDAETNSTSDEKTSGDSLKHSETEKAANSNNDEPETRGDEGDKEADIDGE